jgi:hypothetical protein
MEEFRRDWHTPWHPSNVEVWILFTPNKDGLGLPMVRFWDDACCFSFD